MRPGTCGSLFGFVLSLVAARWRIRISRIGLLGLRHLRYGLPIDSDVAVRAATYPPTALRPRPAPPTVLGP